MRGVASFVLLLALTATARAEPPGDMVLVPAGTRAIGSQEGFPDERPSFSTDIAAFYLDRSPVTVKRFRAFVEASGYVTEAETFGTGAVLLTGVGAWRLVEGANWRKPRGPQNEAAPDDHPVTQVSWNDAEAFCAAEGKRLPTEIEWEHAARFGQDAQGHVFEHPGDAKGPDGYRANVWQGLFPVTNTVADGYRFTAPVGTFGTTPLGLTDMAGNVWEWTASWYRPYAQREAPFTPDTSSERVQRGGSYLCDANICSGFRVTARSHSTPDSALEHVGFRCARDAP
ncbi:MAG: formylglycine-generating enzyme family protein [Alphaproteobacteria bacterium]|nr:formylglycine-generating enzyme family protein [Alphaproteobacteria bacterium]